MSELITHFGEQAVPQKKHKLFLTGPDHDADTALACATALQKEKYLDRKVEHIDGKYLSQQHWSYHAECFPIYNEKKILVITDFDILMTNTAKNIHRRGGIDKNPNSPALYELMNKLLHPESSPILVLSAERNAFNSAAAIISKKDKFLLPLFEGFNTAFDTVETADVVAPSEKKNLWNKFGNFFKKLG